MLKNNMFKQHSIKMQKPAKPKYVNELFQIPIRSGDQETVDEEPLLDPIMFGMSKTNSTESPCLGKTNQKINAIYKVYSGNSKHGILWSESKGSLTVVLEGQEQTARKA